jgi:hypothetical protein
MSLGFDPIALVVALTALVLTLFEIRRNRSVVLRIRQVQGGKIFSLTENNQKEFGRFCIHLENRGRSLHDVQVSLQFRGKDGCGWISTPLQRRDNHDEMRPINGTGEFALGMIGYFGLKSYENTQWQTVLHMLEDPAKQGAIVVVGSHGYVAKHFKIGDGMDLIKKRWNEFTWRINPRFDTWVTVQKRRFRKCGNILPVFPTIQQPLQHYILGLPPAPPPPFVPNISGATPIFQKRS